MSDLISRQAAIDALDAICERECEYSKAQRAVMCGACCLGSAFDVVDELPSAQRWIPVSEGLPEDLEEVNVTWVNHDPTPYYNFIKDKPFTATAVYYKEKWYWYSSTCADVLAEYGRNPNEEIDDGIEIIAWMPLPNPWKGEEDE